MSAIPLIDIDGLVKAYGGDRALRIPHLAVEARDRLVLSGFDAHAAEMFIHLICGASLPDEGVIRVEGIATADVTTDRSTMPAPTVLATAVPNPNAARKLKAAAQMTA